MELSIIIFTLIFVVAFYFRHNPLKHSRAFMIRRFINWFPLGMTYAFLYMARYNLVVTKIALGSAMTKEDFGIIFAVGTVVYGLSFLINGPLVDKIGGKKGIVIAAIGASVANIAMGAMTYLYLNHYLTFNLTYPFIALYSINMFFQSYGGVSIIKWKAYWFHVRERGTFGAIFGTLISIGIYFAFDWGQAIADASKSQIENPTVFQNLFRSIFITGTGNVDSTWYVFFIPSAILIFWAILDSWLLSDTPAQANFEDFDTHDASSGEMDRNFTKGELLKRIFTSRIVMLIAFVEFTTGVIRNGVLQWYKVFTGAVHQPGAEYFSVHWGFLLCMTGIISAFAAGHISDKYFHSRRGPPVAIASGIMLVLGLVMTGVLFTHPFIVGVCAVGLAMFSISIHSMMSGTAAADFGGRKATATASGITDGFVYLGSGLQSACLGFLTTKNWQLWPIFLIPFIMLGIFFALRMWKSLPEATRKFILVVEKVDITLSPGKLKMTKAKTVSTETV